MSRLRAGFDWLLRDRRSGRVVVAQWPNVTAWVYLASLLARRVVPDGAVTVVAVAGTVALVVWAVDEVVRGANPFRRLLGAGVLVAQAVGWWAG
ncbi:MAG: hypothetical protein ABI181_12560 [Mycobacteriaceae bacterium]